MGGIKEIYSIHIARCWWQCGPTKIEFQRTADNFLTKISHVDKYAIRKTVDKRPTQNMGLSKK